MKEKYYIFATVLIKTTFNKIFVLKNSTFSKAHNNKYIHGMWAYLFECVGSRMPQDGKCKSVFYYQKKKI
jgi:hypothetical protein